jgi:hypothetical protein
MVIGAFRPEWSSPQRRLLVLSLMHLTVRFVIENDTQLARQAGIDEAHIDVEIVDWLAGLAARELGLA